MSKRVVYISIFQPGYGGGDGRAAHDMAEHFAHFGEAVLLCPGDKTGLARREDGLQIFSVKSSGQRHIRVPWLTQKTIQEIYDFLEAFRPEVIHAHDPALLALIVQVWAKMWNVPFVYTAHEIPSKILDFGTKDILNLQMDFLAEPVVLRFLEDFYQNCDAVIALNAHVAEKIRAFGYAGRIFTLPNGRDVERYFACRTAALSDAEKIITFVGFIVPRKNQLYLLEVLKHLPGNFRLRLVGESLNESYERQLHAFIEAHNLSNVEFAGPVSYAEVPAYYEAAHVMVSASKMEVQSLVIIEALASGTPVVGLSNETVDELVDETVGCRLPHQTTPAEFAACVVRLCSLPQADYDRLCQQARRRVQHLGWTKVLVRLDEAYTALIHDKELTRPRPEKEAGPLNSLQNAVLLRPVMQDLADRATSVATRVEQVRRVPRRTWLFASLTAAGSVLLCLFVKGRSRGRPA